MNCIAARLNPANDSANKKTLPKAVQNELTGGCDLVSPRPSLINAATRLWGAQGFFSFWRDISVSLWKNQSGLDFVSN